MTTEPCTCAARKQLQDMQRDSSDLTDEKIDQLAPPCPHHTCRHCGEPINAHCMDCTACPDQECPSWCETLEDED